MYKFRDLLQKDTDNYATLAEHIVNAECYCLINGMPTAFRPPLYPLLLAPWAMGGPPSIAGIVILHLILAALTVIGVYILGLMWCDQRGAIAASIWTALDPLLIYQSPQIMTETLAAALAVVALLTLARLHAAPSFRAAMIAGVALGFTVLCRPTFLVWVPLVAIGTLTMSVPIKKRVQFAALVIAFCCLTLLPWVVRNWLVLRHPVIATTHGGYTLWLANNDSYYNYLEHEDQRVPWEGSVLNERQLAIFRDSNFDEVIADRRYQHLALETIHRRPAMFAYSCFRRVANLWDPLAAPRSPRESLMLTVLRIASAVWYLLLYLAAIAGVLRLRHRLLTAPWCWVLSLLLAFTIVHTFYWTDIRMRAPLIPAIALIASLAWKKGFNPVLR